MIFTKGAHQSAPLLGSFGKNQRLSAAQVKFLPNSYFDRLFLVNVRKVSAKSMEELCFMVPKSGAKFEEKLIFLFQKWQKFGEFWSKH